MLGGFDKENNGDEDNAAALNEDEAEPKPIPIDYKPYDDALRHGNGKR
jgi:hypothetical protein